MFKTNFMNIIISGAGKGIGFELCKTLSVNHKIIAISRNTEHLDKLHHNNIFTVPFDLNNTDELINLRKIITAEFNAIDILINNAGMLINKPFESILENDFDIMFQTNIKAPYFLIQELLPLFNKGAHILNISSMGGFMGSAKFTGLSAYSASKGAIAVLSECLAEELKNYEIKSNCLCLGAVQTEMLAQAFPNYQAPVSPNQMAAFIAEFAINGHKYFNGKTLPVSLSTP